MAKQAGGSLINDDHTEWTINSPENVVALEEWASYFKDGLASPDGPLFLDTVPWLSNGTSAILPDGGPWFAAWFDDANGEGWLDEHITFVQNPVGPAGAGSVSGGGSWFVPTDADNKDAAWKFAKFMSEPSSQVEWYKIFKNFPTVREAWEDQALKDEPLLLAVRDSIESGVIVPNVPTWTQVGDAIGQQMEKVVRGNLSAQEALDEAQKQAESIGFGG